MIPKEVALLLKVIKTTVFALLPQTCWMADELSCSTVEMSYKVPKTLHRQNDRQMDGKVKIILAAQLTTE